MPNGLPTRITNTASEARAHRLPPIPDGLFERAHNLVHQSRIPSRIAEWRHDDVTPGHYVAGAAIDDAAILTAWLLAAIEGHAPRNSDIAEILFERMSPEHRMTLQVGRPADRGDLRSAAAQRAIARLLAPIDPYPISRYRRRTRQEAARIVGQHDSDLEARRGDRLDELTRRLITTSVRPSTDRSLEFCLTSSAIFIPGSGPSPSHSDRTKQVQDLGVSDPFAVAFPSPDRAAGAHRPRWGWTAYFAVPYPSLGSPRKLPLIVAGATLQRPGQSDLDAALAVIESARHAGIERLPTRRATTRHRNDRATNTFEAPGLTSSRSDGNEGQHRAERIHARGVSANVLGHLHRKSRGLGHAQLSLAIHLAAMNMMSIAHVSAEESRHRLSSDRRALRGATLELSASSPSWGHPERRVELTRSPKSGEFGSHSTR